MIPEEKNLFLKDLCARLPYGVKVKIKEEGVLSYDSGIGTIVGKEHVDNEIFIIQCKNDSWCLTAISEFVPYLRPMSSMTEGEHQELSRLINDDKLFTGDPAKTVCLHCGVVIDFHNSHYLDWSGLIPMGVAIEAPEWMYNDKTE